MYRSPNPQIRPAAANMPAQRIIYIRIAGIRSFLQQRRARHDHSRLAIAALRNLGLEPGALQGMRAIRRQSLDGQNLAVTDGRNPRGARSFRHAINMHSASPAKRLPAPKFRPSQLQRIAQNPQQRRIRTHIHGQILPIHVQIVGRQPAPPKKSPAKSVIERILHASQISNLKFEMPLLRSHRAQNLPP